MKPIICVIGLPAMTEDERRPAVRERIRRRVDEIAHK